MDGCTSLVSVHIPNNVTLIDSYAFNNCTKLFNINIPNGVTAINSYAFRNCSSLISLTIPNSVNTIGGSSVFVGCSSNLVISTTDRVYNLNKSILNSFK